MRKYIITLIVVLLPLGLFAQENQTINWESILHAVTIEKEFKVDINQVTPRSRTSFIPSVPFSIKIKSDILTSFLPDIDDATHISFGNKQGLNFTAPIKNYKTNLSKKEKLTVSFNVKNDIDSFDYTLTIFENGKTTLVVKRLNRVSNDYISFGGNLVIPQSSE